MSCKMCGKCCEAIYMGVSPDRIKEMVDYKPILVGMWRRLKPEKATDYFFIRCLIFLLTFYATGEMLIK